jgi:hypothetical protein
MVAVGWRGRLDRNASNEERQRLMRQHGANLAEPFRSAILWIPEDQEIKYSELGVWVPGAWGTQDGRVTLAGDAAVN